MHRESNPTPRQSDPAAVDAGGEQYCLDDCIFLPTEWKSLEEPDGL